MSYVIQNIAEQITGARKLRGLTQAELASKLDLPQSYISRIESGRVDVRVSSLIQLARVLGLELTLLPREHIHFVEALTGSQSEDAFERPAYVPDEENEQ